MALDILIVDDEADIRELVAGVLGDEGFDTRTAANAEGALAALAERGPAWSSWMYGCRAVPWTGSSCWMR